MPRKRKPTRQSVPLSEIRGHIPLQYIIDHLYPDNLFPRTGLLTESDSDSDAEKSFQIRIPDVQALGGYVEKSRLATILKRLTQSNGTKIAEFLGVDKSQISRYEKKAMQKPLKIFFIALEIECSDQSFFDVVTRLGEEPIEVFHWQGTHGRVPWRALQAAQYLCSGIIKNQTLITELQKFIEHEIKTEADHWQSEFERYKIPLHDPSISDILNTAPHYEWERAVRLVRSFREQPPQESTVQIESEEQPVFKPKSPRSNGPST